MKIYLAGPMRGYPRFNFDTFAKAAKHLRAKGEEVVSPAEMDLEEGFDPDNPGVISVDRYEEWMRRDFKAILDCDAVALLPGWRLSEGARREYQHAVKNDKFTILIGQDELNAMDGPQPCDRCKQMHAPTEECRFEYEVRVTNEKTGGQKGSKPARFDLIPAKALWLVAELYGAGARKYEAHNWRRGYDWSLSIAALERHLAQFKEGENDDPETGCPHLAAVVFHALSLLTFTEEHPELDDRWKGTT